MHRLDWNDLQYVLVVADRGSLASAARELAVNRTTVLRRIGALEKHLGVRLFERLPAGYTLTSAGEELATTARGMADSVTAVERRIEGRDLRLTGTLRVTTTDTIMSSILSDHLAAFTRAHPGVVLEVTTSNMLMSLTRREADVAVRPSPMPPEDLVGRRIGTIAFAPYASLDYLKKARRSRPLREHVWVAPNDSLSATSFGRWMDRELEDARVVLRSNSLTAMCNAARSGVGVAALPCYVGDTTEGLLRLEGPIDGLATELWVLTHEDLRHTARVRTFTSFIGEALATDRPLLEGLRPRRSRR